MAQEQNNPLQPLTHRIRGPAHNIAHRYNANPEDVEQDLIVLLLERYVQDPDFLNDPVSAVNWAANRAGWRARKALNHAKICIEDRPMTNDPDDRTLVEVYADSTNPWPEVEQALVIEAAMAGMDSRDRTICTMLADGYSAREIASVVGCWHTTVYNRMSAISQALQ